MEITEVRIKLMEDSEDRLRAFCSITFDQCFVIRDLKIIEGTSAPFVAMPSRKLTGRCGKCGYKNHLRCNYCNQCGVRLRGGHDLKDSEGGSNRLYADIAHPINQACRDMIQSAVIKEYHLELERAKLPGYKSRYDDDYFETPLAPFPTEANPGTTERSPSGISGSHPSGPPKPHFNEIPTGKENAIVDPGSTSTDGFGKGILDGSES
jgi:stage V sporulation protein G